MFFGWQWVLVDGGERLWIYFGWWWVMVDGGGSWWVVAQFSLTQIKMLNFYSVSRVSGLDINKNVCIMHYLSGIRYLDCSKMDQTHKTNEIS